MKYLWQLISPLAYDDRIKQRLFLLLNTLAFSVAGMIIWLMVGKLVAPGWQWMICFIGYPGYFIGYLGGLFYLYKIY